MASEQASAYRLVASEYSRRQYLAALGIVQYQARQPLPFAQTGPDYDWSLLADSTTTAPVAALMAPVVTPAQAEAVVAPQPPRIRTPLVQSGEAQATENAAPVPLSAGEPAQWRISPPAEFSAQPVAQRPARANPDARFSLFVSRPVAGRLLVAQPERPQSWLAAMEQRLVEDLIRAIAQDVTADASGQFFHWPLLPTPGQPHGVVQAHDAFVGFMEPLVQRGDIALLVFSGAAAARVFPTDAAATLFDWVLAERSVRVCVIPALTELLQDWRNKALAWQRLRTCLNLEAATSPSTTSDAR